MPWLFGAMKEPSKLPAMPEKKFADRMRERYRLPRFLFTVDPAGGYPVAAYKGRVKGKGWSGLGKSS